MFNDDLSLNASTGKFGVTDVLGQDRLNSDMLILSLPAGVDGMVVSLQNPAFPLPDTINFMVAPVPEASTVSLLLLGERQGPLSPFGAEAAIQLDPTLARTPLISRFVFWKQHRRHTPNRKYNHKIFQRVVIYSATPVKKFRRNRKQQL